MIVDLKEYCEKYAEDLIGCCALGDRWQEFRDYHVFYEAGEFYGATNVPEYRDELDSDLEEVICNIVYECACCGWYVDANDEANDSEGQYDGDVCDQCYKYDVVKEEDDD